MLVEGIPLRVKLGPPALEAVELLQLEREISSAEWVIKNTKNVVDEANTSAVKKGRASKHECENAALRYVAKKRAGMEVYYICEELFHEFQRKYLLLMEDERVARRRLDDLHADIKNRAAVDRSAKYFMSTKCVWERFAMEEEAREKKVNMLEEYAGFLSALRFAEEEERQEAVRRAKTRWQASVQQTVVHQRPQNVYGGAGAMNYMNAMQPSNQPQGPLPQVSASYNPSGRPYSLPPAFLEHRQWMQQQQQQQQPAPTGFYATPCGPAPGSAPGGGGGGYYRAPSVFPPFQATAMPQGVPPQFYPPPPPPQQPQYGTGWQGHPQGRVNYPGI